ncbi:MAG: YwaF family protein [Clostridia bacterium]|nr:YwaF family protein [Clostridia bacterium]
METINKFLTDLMTATAWTMEKPKAYGSFHLTFTIVGFAVCVLLAYLLRNLGERGNRRLLTSVGLFLIITEVYKQLFYTYYIGGGEYQWWIFPFQLCSIPMYLCVIAPWVKSKRLSRAMYAFMTTFNLLGGFITFFEPSGIVHGYWTLTLHAFIWHMALVFIGFYLVASGRGATEKQHLVGAILTFLVLCVVAFCINLLFWGPSNGSINMFFVGPKNSSLIVFKQISEAAGWYVSTLLYIPAVCAGASLFFLPVYLWNKKKKSASPATENAESPEKVPTRVS